MVRFDIEFCFGQGWMIATLFWQETKLNWIIMVLEWDNSGSFTQCIEDVV